MEHLDNIPDDQQRLRLENYASTGDSFLDSIALKTPQVIRNKIPAKTLFIKGPILVSTIFRAASLGGKCTEVLLAIILQTALKHSREVKISRKTLGLFNVLPDAGARAIKKMELAELISVKRHRGRCPIVTQLF